MTSDQHRFLDAQRRTDGRYVATWSRRPGERVQVVMLAGAVVTDDLAAVDRYVRHLTDTLDAAREVGKDLT